MIWHTGVLRYKQFYKSKAGGDFQRGIFLCELFLKEPHYNRRNAICMGIWSLALDTFFYWGLAAFAALVTNCVLSFCEIMTIHFWGNES